MLRINKFTTVIKQGYQHHRLSKLTKTGFPAILHHGIFVELYLNCSTIQSNRWTQSIKSYCSHFLPRNSWQLLNTRYLFNTLVYVLVHTYIQCDIFFSEWPKFFLYSLIIYFNLILSVIFRCNFLHYAYYRHVFITMVASI